MYDVLTNADIDAFLQADEQLNDFIDNEAFQKFSQMRNWGLVKNSIRIYKQEILYLMKLLLPHLAKGFSDHRRDMFGFGPHKDEDTGKLLKVSEYAKSVKSM